MTPPAAPEGPGAQPAARPAVRGNIFPVLHDHGDGKFAETCTGSLRISRNSISFQSDTGKEVFQWSGSAVRSVEKAGGGLVGKLTFRKNAGDLAPFEVRLLSGKSYLFAPASGDREQARERILAAVKAGQ